MTAIDAAGKNVVFVVGSPRSGTTWLARLMGAHPEVAAAQETQLVNRYCGSWYDAWHDQLPADGERWARHRHRGLPAVLTAEELDDYVVGFARGVYEKILGLKPGARVVVDKDPEYSLHVDLVRRMFPDAAILHVVRDGRDVAASMLAASRGWGRDWAPARVRAAAQTWRTNVESARAAATSGRYVEVRYEDLLADAPRVVGEALAFAGVAASAEECAGLVARFAPGATGGDGDGDSLVWSGEVVRRLGRPPREPDGFFGAGAHRGWRATWTARDRLDFDDAAGELLRTLGYADADADWVAVGRGRRRGASVVRRAGRAAARLGWRLHMLLGRRGLYVHVARVAPYAEDRSR